MKNSVKIVLISAHLIVATYLIVFCLTPGYLVPFLNNPIWRPIILVALSLFALESTVIVFLLKENTFLYKLSLWFFVICLLVPNILLPVLGPAIAPACPIEFIYILIRDQLHLS